MRSDLLTFLVPSLLFVAACNEYDLSVYENSDVFFQNPADEVDILLVVDNSCSMADEQARLGSSFEQFLTYFVEADVDYQIGVTTTSVTHPEPAGGCTQSDIQAAPAQGHLADGTFITPDTANKAEVFDNLVNQGICGAGYEQGLETARLALSEPNLSGVNAGFIREAADLSIIVVSDEHDASPLPVNDYINHWRDLKGQRSRDVFHFSSLVITDPSECFAAAVDSPAIRYIDVAEQTGGVVHSICELDFEDIVTDLSLNASRLRDTFYLSDTPQLSTLRVGVDVEEIPCGEGGWWFDMVFDEVEQMERPAIIFERESLPPPSAQVSARYQAGDVEDEHECRRAEGE